MTIGVATIVNLANDSLLPRSFSFLTKMCSFLLSFRGTLYKKHAWIGYLDVCILSLFNHVRLFVTLWTVPARLFCPLILQARILKWVTVPSSMASSQTKGWTWVSCGSISGRIFTTEQPAKPSWLFICCLSFLSLQLPIYLQIQGCVD